MTRKLIRYENYNRQEIHDIFSPDTKFYRGAGSWGLHGIVKVPNTDRDYIFFVTYGSEQSGHIFEEGIDENGVLTWQTQPSMSFDNKDVMNFINHDEEMDNIYLFLRTDKKQEFSYLGLLAYVAHDPSKERPVYFWWRILDFDKNKTVKALNGIAIKKKAIEEKGVQGDRAGLKLKDAPINSCNITTYESKDFISNVDFASNEEKNACLGRLGEDAVVKYEKERLSNAGKIDLARKVIATRDTIGNAARYDVHSYNLDGSVRFIEVKTTCGSIRSRFYISEREVIFSERHSKQYYLYRVFNFDCNTGTGELYIRPGAIDRNTLRATNYVTM